MTKPLAVVIMSGGMDSATLAWYTIGAGYDIRALSFNYGQRHARELTFAQIQTAMLDVSHSIVDLTSLKHLLAGSSLTSENVVVPDGHYTEETMKATVVPNRNSIMLSIAFGYAVSIGAELVTCGVHAGDHAIYPDCREDFADAFQTAMLLANRGFSMPSLHLSTPFVRIAKSDIVKLGDNMGVPWSMTWSCYKGGDVHCGRCGTCVERQEAFAIAKVLDPTAYADPNFWRQEVERKQLEITESDVPRG